MSAPRPLAVVLAVAVGALAVVTPAAAEVTGTGTDPAGDAANPAPGVDIVGFGVTYDGDTGEYEAEVRLRGAPTASPSGLIAVSIGPRVGEACGFPSTSLTSLGHAAQAFWAYLDALGGDIVDGAASQTGSGTATQTFSARTTQLAGRPATCAQAAVLVPGVGEGTYDVTAPIALRPPREPKLAIKVKNVAKGLRVTVRNRGNAPARKVTVRFGKAFGMRFLPRRRPLRTIRAGRHKASVFRVVIAPRANRVTKLDLRATARGGFLASGTLTVRIKGERRPPPRRPRGGGGDDGTDPLRYANCLGGDFTLIPCLL